MATNYDINYNDERFTQVEADKKAALSEVEKTYGGMISESDKYYQAQIDASKQWADKQTQLQNQQTNQAIKEINQQKDQAKKDYTKEQSGAYVDWQKQSNQYGVNAEQMAAQGMTGTGYSESSQVSMYNTYQNRVATARESYNRAVLNYDNSIAQARLQNSSALAEIAYQALQKQLELSLQGFQHKNQLIIEQANKKQETEQIFHNRWQDVLSQINHENAFKYQQDRDTKEDEQEAARLAQQKEIADAQLAEEIRQFNILHPADSGGSGTISGGGSGGSGSSGSSGGSGITKTSKTTNVETPIDKANKWKETKKETSNSSSGGVDMASVLSLGYGPISAARAWELVKEGLAETYVKDGKTYFRKSSKYLKQKKLFGF